MYVLQDVQYISGLGIIVFYVTDVFTVHKCQVSTGLAYVRPVACFACQFVYAAFVVVLCGVMVAVLILILLLVYKKAEDCVISFKFN